jgi:hypothetical protein
MELRKALDGIPPHVPSSAPAPPAVEQVHRQDESWLITGYFRVLQSTAAWRNVSSDSGCEENYGGIACSIYLVSLMVYYKYPSKSMW